LTFRAPSIIWIGAIRPCACDEWLEFGSLNTKLGAATPEGIMALSKCPECNGQVSTTAKSCPHCGNTQFTAPTGRRVRVTCCRCKGLGEHDYGHEYIDCRRCHSTGLVDVPEYKNLLEGSLFHRDDSEYVSENEYLLWSIMGPDRPIDPNPPIACPRCGERLVYMRSDPKGHVYRCHIKPWKVYHEPDPCFPRKVILCRPDGTLVQMSIYLQQLQ
jgi:hypothetical protein